MRPKVDALERALRAGPGNKALVALRTSVAKAKTSSSIFTPLAEGLDAAKLTPAFAAGTKLFDAVEMEIQLDLRAAFDLPKESEGQSKELEGRIFRFSPGPETRPMGSQTPELRAEMRIRAFLPLWPFIRRIFSVCPNEDFVALWHGDKLPYIEPVSNRNIVVPGDDKFRWCLLTNAIMTPLASCTGLLEYFLPNRWIRRRLATDAAYLDSAAQAFLLNSNRLHIHIGSPATNSHGFSNLP